MKSLALFAATALISKSIAADTDKMLVFIGTYTGGESKGIYSYELSMADGSLKEIGLAAETPSPSFLAIHPGKEFLYSVGEAGNGTVSAFKINAASGKLEKINDASSRGAGPCYLIVDKAGKNVLVANYGGGSATVLRIENDGSLGGQGTFVQHRGSSVNPRRQKEPHAHSINLDAANRFAFVADLGLDKIMIYKFDPEKGMLTENEPYDSATVAPGGGPRHFAFSPDGKRAYVNLEMTSQVTAFNYDSGTGALTETQTISTLPADWEGNNSTAEIQVHPSGKFVYCSNRGHNSVAVFSVGSDGKLALVENESTRGRTPRNFGIDPTGRYLVAANQDSNTLAVFRINQSTGALDPIGEPVPAPKPVCVKFLALD